MKAKKWFKGMTTVATLALLLALAAIPAKADSNGLGPTEVHNKIVAYFADWDIYGRNYQVTDIDASKVTQINYAFAAIDNNGEITSLDPWADYLNPYLKGVENSPIKGCFGQLINLKKEHPGLQTIISVGGWSGSGKFSDVALTDASRTKFADSVVKFLRDYQFDGVDLDWEYPVAGGLDTNVRRPEDKQNFTLLLQTIREKLDVAGQQDHKKYLLTIAAGATKSYVQNTEMDKIDKIVDWINLMTYDFHGAWENVTGNDAPLYSHDGSVLNDNTAVKLFENAGVRAKHLVLGVPFYGKGWDGVSPTNNGEFQPAAGPAKTGTWQAAIYDYTDLESNYINKNGFTSYWDDVEKEPYLYNPTTGTFITYENTKSIEAKTDYIKDNHLGGAMLWEISGDRNETLLSALAKGVLK